MDKKRSSSPSYMDMLDDILATPRQFLHEPEFGIDPPSTPAAPEADPAGPEPQAPPSDPAIQTAHGTSPSPALVAEFATFLWYLKTKYFKRDWATLDTGDDDARVRRLLGRLERAIQVLRDNGVEVQDPTGKRYPPGGESLMHPIDRQQQDGIACDIVAETVTPIIYLSSRLIQRAEVFVAVAVDKPFAAGTAPDSAPEDPGPAPDTTDACADT